MLLAELGEMLGGGGGRGRSFQEALVIIIPKMMLILRLSGTRISACHSPSHSPLSLAFSPLGVAMAST